MEAEEAIAKMDRLLAVSLREPDLALSGSRQSRLHGATLFGPRRSRDGAGLFARLCAPAARFCECLNTAFPRVCRHGVRPLLARDPADVVDFDTTDAIDRAPLRTGAAPGERR